MINLRKNFKYIRLVFKGTLEQDCLVSARANRDENDLGFDNFLKPADILLSLCRQAGKASHVVERFLPAFHLFINRLGILHYLETRGKIVQELAATAVISAYGNLLETRKDIQFGQGDAGNAVYSDRIMQAHVI